MRDVNMPLSATKTEEITPADVPTKEKLISPLIPQINPIITTSNVEQVSMLVVFPSTRYVNMTLKTKDRQRATLSNHHFKKHTHTQTHKSDQIIHDT